MLHLLSSASSTEEEEEQERGGRREASLENKEERKDCKRSMAIFNKPIIVSVLHGMFISYKFYAPPFQTATAVSNGGQKKDQSSAFCSSMKCPKIDIKGTVLTHFMLRFHGEHF